MADRISDATAKIERAKKHIRELESARAAFLATNPYAATPEYYVEQNVTVYFLDGWEPVPDSILLPCGDAVHNLRSSLDYLWWQRSEVCTGGKPDPKRKPTFPIFDDRESFEKSMSKPGRKVEAEALIKRTKDVLLRSQPYKGGNDTIWGLNQLDYIDKHCFLITAAIAPKQLGIQTGGRSLERLFHGNVRFASGELPQQIARFNILYIAFLGMAKGDPIFCLAGNFESSREVQLTFDVALAEPEVFKSKSLLE